MKLFFALLICSIIFLILVSISTHHFLALYYVIWIFGVGGWLYRNKESVEKKLLNLNLGSAKKFILLGLLMILLEETLAGISMHLASVHNIFELVIGILQFYAINFLALPGFIIAWYFLLKRYEYSRKEVLILVGLFGLFAEKVYFQIISNPVAGLFIVLPTMCTYAIIITPSLLSFKADNQKQIFPILKYTLGLIMPVIFSIPFIAVAIILKTHYPGLFPPEGFVM
jgi:hypothetical protein